MSGQIYDYFLTASAEVDHVWNRSPAIVTLLYYVSRYTPFLDTAVVGLYWTFMSNPSPEVCYAWISAQSYAAVLGLSVANLVMAGQVPPGHAESLMMVNIPTRCLHSIFASRMFLHIREAGSNSIIVGEEAITLQTLKTIAFAPAAARQGPDEFDMTTLSPTQDARSLAVGEREDA
ncbi:hypothetical protein BU15DRAFT_73947 [Melanogaster broomeanus]|nr:hypothetical protein BU15DRAFT_73947 [Melanogaster broomeanus]